MPYDQMSSGQPGSPLAGLLHSSMQGQGRRVGIPRFGAFPGAGQRMLIPSMPQLGPGMSQIPQDVTAMGHPQTGPGPYGPPLEMQAPGGRPGGPMPVGPATQPATPPPGVARGLASVLARRPM